MKLGTQALLSAFILAGSIGLGAPAGMAQTAQPSTIKAAAPATEAAGGMGMGMMGKGTKSGGMGDDSMQMMSMMRDMMGMMREHTGMMSAHAGDRITALKTELKITDAQLPQWTRFADALAEDKSTSPMREQMGKDEMPSTLADRLDRHEKMLTAHLTSLKTLKEALAPLYGSLTDEQKKIIDKSMIGPMGMM